MNRYASRAVAGSLVAAAVLVLSGCSDIKRSRSVDDAGVKGNVLAVQVCSSCHGITGESISPMFPKLAGQQKEYLTAQLTDFKGHERKDSKGAQYMWGYADLTRSQVDEIVEYFSSQPPMRPDTTDASTEVLARGEQIFRQGVPEHNVTQCAACHGDNGTGNEAIPRIAGQHAHYLLEQIKVFQTSDKRPRGAPMQLVTHELSDDDAEAVAAYISTLSR